MRISELAALAGVTIRTLRQYHQMGLLQEPGCSADDYREYDVRHLARLLRIIRLTELGVPLAELRELLDDPAAAADLLDRLDEETAAEIRRLTSRRAVIAVLRQHGAVPDLRPAAVRYEAELQAAASAPADVKPEPARHEREQLALLDHLVGEARTAALARTLAQLAPLTPGSAEVLRRFAALGRDTPDGDVERLADEMTERYRPLLAALRDVEIAYAGAPLLTECAQRAHNLERTHKAKQTHKAEQTYNEQQVRVLRAFEERVRSG